MLKVVLMDLFPYLIDKKNINKYVWKNVLGNDEYEEFSRNELLSSFLEEDLSEKDVAEKFINIENNQKFIDIINQYEDKHKILIKKFFEDYQFDEVFVKFFEDAKTSNCDIVLINNDDEFKEYVRLIKIPSNVYLSCNFGNINIDNLEETLTNKSIALNEFIYFTNDQTIIDELIEKGYFCATISNNSDNSNLIAINSINELNFGNLALNFYDKNDESVGEL